MLKPKFTSGNIRAYFAKQRKTIDLLLIRELQILGEKCVNICRDLDTYQDDTGNLRSSIGYVLYVGFKKYSENFETKPGKGSSSGEIGKGSAERVADELVSTIVSKYYSLIIVAGMDYAEEVEARDYAVLSPGELFAESEIPKLKRRILNAYKKAS